MLAEPAGRAGITCEKCRQSLREESVKPTEGHKAFEKCGGIVPREVTDEVRREVQRKRCEKSRRSRREGFMYLTTTSRDGVTLLVAKQPFPSRSDTSRDEVTLLHGLQSI